MLKVNIFNKHLCYSIFLFLAALAFFISCGSDNDKQLVFIGTYTSNGSEGIYSFQFDPEDGETTQPILAARSDNPSFIAIDNAGNFLYAVNEVDKYDENSSGTISVLKLLKIQEN